ncbi:MAG: TIR domain-containing protein [Cystobacterineae bacterium]|nr:TIR domain-containing protein [Cystobacterineae bacterium]
MKVFVSYSHENKAHSARVLELADALNIAGIDTELDQYHSTSELSWWRWCEEQIRRAHFVLMICTPVYRERIENPYENPDTGLGVCWEADYIYEKLYELKGRNKKYLPVLLDENDRSSIPERLRGYSCYALVRPYPKCEGFQKLVDRLNEVNRTPKPPLGEPAPLQAMPASINAMESLNEDGALLHQRPMRSPVFNHTTRESRHTTRKSRESPQKAERASAALALESAQAALHLIESYSKTGNLQVALKMFEAMAELGNTPDIALCRAKAALNLIDDYGRAADLPKAHMLFESMAELGDRPEIALCRAKAAARLIDDYVKAQNLYKAKKLFKPTAKLGSTKTTHESSQETAPLMEDGTKAQNLPEIEKLLETMAQLGDAPELRLERAKAAFSLKS